MTFRSHSASGFSCALSREELKAYDIDIDAVRPDRAEYISEKLHDLVQDAVDNAKREFDWEADGMMEVLVRKMPDDSLILDIKKHNRLSDARPVPEEKTATWDLIEAVEDYRGFALQFKTIAMAAAYLRSTKKAMDDNQCICPFLFKGSGGYVLDVTYDPAIAEEIGESEDKRTLQHIICTATEYAEHIYSGETYRHRLSWFEEHMSVIASYPEEFELIMRFGTGTHASSVPAHPQ